MYKTTIVDIEIEVEDIEEFLEDEFYDLDIFEVKKLIKVMKRIVLDGCYYEGKPFLNANNIIDFLKNNPNIAQDVKEYFNQNEVV